METSKALQRFQAQMTQQLEAHRAVLEKLVADQREQVQAQQQEVLDKMKAQQQELLEKMPKELPHPLAHDLPQPAHEQPHVQLSPSRARDLVSRAFSKESTSSREKFADVADKCLRKLEQQYTATEGLHDQVRSLLEGGAERHVADRLEVLYARHEARIENLLVQNEKAMEDWLGQVRMVQHAADGKERGNRRTFPSASEASIMLPAESPMRALASDGVETRSKSVGHFRGRRHDVPLDIAALSAVQGWSSITQEKKTRSPRIRSHFFPHLHSMSEATLESASAILVMSNLVFMGIDAQVSLAATKAGEPAPAWLWGTSVCFLVMLILELCARASLERWGFLTGRNWMWNCFDVVLVTFQILDTILVLYNLNFLRALRVLRALRTTRAVKTMKSVRELRVMIASIGNSVVSLLWAFVLLFMALYAVSLVLMQSLVAHVEARGPDQVNEQLFTFYGSMEKSMVSLFKAVSGGQLWGDFLKPLEEISVIYVVAFMAFITFTVFGMLNVLTAIFVESTSKMSAFDHDLVIKEHLDAKNSTASQLRKLLLEADIDRSGTISRKEFESKLSDPLFANQLSVLELDIYEAQGLFNILRYEDTQGVPIEEFIYGLMRMKGNAKGVDMVTMLSENRRILAKLLAFMEFVDDSMLDMRTALHIPGDICLQDYLDAA